MIRPSTSLLFSSALAIGLAAPAICLAVAVPNAYYTAGDLLLTFQKVGSTNTVYADLGSAATVFRGVAAGSSVANKINFLDLNATLTTAFGAGWASDPQIYAGLAGFYGTSTTSTVLLNGDPARTLYVSVPRADVGTVGQANSTAVAIATNTLMTTAAAAIQAQNNIFADNDPNTIFGYQAQVIISPTSVSKIDDNQPITVFQGNNTQGVAFGAIDGGIQQSGTAGTFGTFGAAGSVKIALDLYRVLAKNTVSGQVAGDLRAGSYEGTVTINSSGQVSFISQGAASSAYDSWMASFPTITAPADKLPTADPDGDGVTNLAEFGFGGDPSHGADNGVRLVQTVDANGDTLKDLTLKLEVRSGATFTTSGSDLVSGTVDTVTYRVQGSVDLVNWTSAVSEVSNLGTGSPKAGYEFHTFRLNAGNGLSGKGFLRASVTQ